MSKRSANESHFRVVVLARGVRCHCGLRQTMDVIPRSQQKRVPSPLWTVVYSKIRESAYQCDKEKVFSRTNRRIFLWCNGPTFRSFCDFCIKRIQKRGPHATKCILTIIIIPLTIVYIDIDPFQKSLLFRWLGGILAVQVFTWLPTLITGCAIDTDPWVDLALTYVYSTGHLSFLKSVSDGKVIKFQFLDPYMGCSFEFLDIAVILSIFKELGSSLTLSDRMIANNNRCSNTKAL